METFFNSFFNEYQHLSLVKPNIQPTIQNLIDLTNKTDYFESEILDLKNQFPIILSDFIKYYDIYKSSPSNTEYFNMYQEVYTKLMKINSDLLLLIQKIKDENSQITNLVKLINNEMSNEKKSYTGLLGQVNNLFIENNTSGNMVNEYKENYKNLYYKNIIMIIGIIGLICFLISRKKNFS